MFCLTCNTQNPVAARYCDACGEPLRPAEVDDLPLQPKRMERHLERERNWRNF